MSNQIYADDDIKFGYQVSPVRYGIDGPVTIAHDTIHTIDWNDILDQPKTDYVELLSDGKTFRFLQSGYYSIRYCRDYTSSSTTLFRMHSYVQIVRPGGPGGAYDEYKKLENYPGANIGNILTGAIVTYLPKGSEIQCTVVNPNPGPTTITLRPQRTEIEIVKIL